MLNSQKIISLQSFPIYVCFSPVPSPHNPPFACNNFVANILHIHVPKRMRKMCHRISVYMRSLINIIATGGKYPSKDSFPINKGDFVVISTLIIRRKNNKKKKNFLTIYVPDHYLKYQCERSMKGEMLCPSVQLWLTDRQRDTSFFFFSTDLKIFLTLTVT